MYIGKVYIGSRFLQWDVVFDTVNSHTVISDTYDVDSSSTSTPVNVRVPGVNGTEEL
jgi:hypothetical protein